MPQLKYLSKNQRERERKGEKLATFREPKFIQTLWHFFVFNEMEFQLYENSDITAHFPLRGRGKFQNGRMSNHLY